MDHWWQDWGQLIRTPPPPCFGDNSAVRAEVVAKSSVIGQRLVAWQEKLSGLGEQNLFAGVDTGWETGISNLTNLTEIPAVHRVALGYCALSQAGYSAGNPPADMEDALARVVVSFASLESWSIMTTGIPKDMVYTHIAAVNYSGTAPLWTAFTGYSTPGFSVYGTGDGILEIVNEQHSRWAVTEASWMIVQNPILCNAGLDLVNICNWDGDPSADSTVQYYQSAQAAIRAFLNGGCQAANPRG